MTLKTDVISVKHTADLTAAFLIFSFMAEAPSCSVRGAEVFAEAVESGKRIDAGDLPAVAEDHFEGISVVEVGELGILVAEEDGVLMICPKDDAAAMRRLHTLAHLDTLEE